MYSRISVPQSAVFVFSNLELDALAKVWKERMSGLRETGAYAEFLKKMHREWAIETGIIERLYTWDRGVTEVLIQQGIDPSLIAHKAGVQTEEAQRIFSLIADQYDIVEGLFQFVKDEQPLTEHYIRSMHQVFTSHQTHTEAITPDGTPISVELLRGVYKKWPNNPRRPDGTMHEYCPPELVADEMGRLIELYDQQKTDRSPDSLSAWLHHAFTQIHPFQDGNGRVARALASLVYLKAGLFPLVIRDQDRTDYIAALEAADDGDIGPLVRLFGARQRTALLKAIGIEQQVRESHYAEEILESAFALLKSKGKTKEDDVKKLHETATNLHKATHARFTQIANTIQGGLQSISLQFGAAYKVRVHDAAPDDERSGFHKVQIIDTARHFDYFANIDDHKSWVRLAIDHISGKLSKTFEYIISIHGYGVTDRGIMAVSAFTSRRAPREGGGTDLTDIRPACTDVFQFNYAESVDSTEKRYLEWLEASLAIALAEWKRTLQRSA